MLTEQVAPYRPDDPRNHRRWWWQRAGPPVTKGGPAHPSTFTWGHVRPRGRGRKLIHLPQTAQDRTICCLKPHGSLSPPPVLLAIPVHL